jgi:hypothetical protein
MKYYKQLLSGQVVQLDTQDPVPEDAVEISQEDFESAQTGGKSKTSFEQHSWEVKRRLSYPPFTDYLDGIVKGDQAQIDAYIAACQAVKAQYPKT